MLKYRLPIQFLAGLVFVLAFREFLRVTPVADWVVAPLLSRDLIIPADAIVVLGGGVKGACEPNTFTLRRVLLGLRSFREGLAPLVVFTGGYSGDSGCVLAHTMAAMAQDLGLPEASARIEPGSMSTWTNAERTEAVLRAAGASRILLVTDQLHMRRAAGAFERFGFTVGRRSVPANVGHDDNIEILTMGLREYAALAWYRFRGMVATTATDPAAASTVTSTPRRSAPLSGDCGPPSAPVVILGASYAGSWPLQTLGGRRVVNVGINGQQSGEMLARFDRDVLPHGPRAVLIWGFINDVFRSPPEQMSATLARTRQSLSELVRLSKNHGIEPIVVTEIPMPGPLTWNDSARSFAGRLLGRQSYQDRINGLVSDTNAWLRELAVREGVCLLDFETALSGRSNSRRAEFTSADRSHISDAGYRKLTAVAESELSGRLAECR